MHSLALREALSNLLSSDKIFTLFCEGVDDGFYGTIDGLSKVYPSQCYELPCSENASVGMALGASLYGLMPIVCFQRTEFALLAFEQFINNTDRINYLSDGKRVPKGLYRLVIGRGWGQGPSHSQSLESLFIQIPNISLFLPVFPEDSEYIISQFRFFGSIAISLEHRWVHSVNRSNMPVISPDPYVVREGHSLCIVASSYNVILALTLANIYKDHNISLEVINLFCPTSTNLDPIFNSAEKCRQVLFIELGTPRFGISNSLLASSIEHGIKNHCSYRIVGAKSSHAPSSYLRITDFYLSISDIAREINFMLSLSCELSETILSHCAKVEKLVPPDQPNPSFTGPF